MMENRHINTNLRNQTNGFKSMFTTTNEPFLMEVAWMGNETNGYPRSCRVCAQKIWMQFCLDERWKPFDYPNLTMSNNWELHNCLGRLLWCFISAPIPITRPFTRQKNKSNVLELGLCKMKGFICSITVVYIVKDIIWPNPGVGLIENN